MIVAEVGGNHGGNFGLAKKYVEEVAKTGADAVKFQMITAEKLVVKEAPVVPPVTQYRTQREWFKSLELTSEQWTELAELAKKRGIMFLASAFDKEAVDSLNKIVPAFKIASGDFTNLPLIRHAIRKNKPIIMSTGGTTIEEIKRVTKEVPKDLLVLLHCISAYPSEEKDAHLHTIPFLKEKLGVTVGYSDHTKGTLAPQIAVALGAQVIEKHFILDRTQQVGDYVLSAEPGEMKEMVNKIRRIEKMQGVRTAPTKIEKKFMPSLRRSLAAGVDVPRGSTVTEDKIVSLRPARGISPLLIDEVVGKKAKRNIRKGEIFTKGLLTS